MLYSVSHDCRSREILFSGFSLGSFPCLCPASLPTFNIDICLPLCLLHQNRRVQIGQGAIPLRVEESLQFLFAGPVFPFFRLLHQLEQCLPIGFTKKLHRPGLKGFDFLVSVIVGLFLRSAALRFFNAF